MKKMKKLFALLLTLSMSLCLVACGEEPEKPEATDDNLDRTITYAVEAGSTAEEIALEKDLNAKTFPTQMHALTDVDTGNSKACICDSVLAYANVGEGKRYANLKVNPAGLNEELLGVACRKGSDLASFVNYVLSETYMLGTMQEVAKEYGIEDLLVAQTNCKFDQAANDSDVQYIKDKGTLVIGMTEYAPLNFKGLNGSWIGFDADMAKLVAGKLGVEAVFSPIDRNRQLEALNTKYVDVLWNGMTITEARQEVATFSNAYCNNAQVIVSK